MCMCFLFLGEKFSATALLSEETRIKNTYTDGTKSYAYRTKYTCLRQCTIFGYINDYTRDL